MHRWLLRGSAYPLWGGRGFRFTGTGTDSQGPIEGVVGNLFRGGGPRMAIAEQ